MLNQVEILDCTLRDGGYYTNWDFDNKIVDTYLNCCNNLPIQYLEIGYRSIPLKDYHGEYFYLPIHVLKRLKNKSVKKLVIILNEKDINVNDIFQLLQPCLGIIDLVRIAVDPREIVRATTLALEIKKMGFKVAFNVMYMSRWKSQNNFFENLSPLNSILEYFYMVDSFGGVYPSDVKEAISLVREVLPNVKLGFHGHNNIELALINTLTAIEGGCSIVDATITGMGRGAGNLKTELLLSVLNSNYFLDVNFNSLSKVVDEFTLLQKQYGWGTNLPYMFSGANSLPQKDVMNWVGKSYYSFNSIIRALQNESSTSNVNIYEPFIDNTIWDNVIIIGGGDSIELHKEAIFEYLRKNEDVAVIHASSKNAIAFKELKNRQYFCLLGNEGYRMEDVFNNDLPDDCTCILPPSPRKMGTYIPKSFKGETYELKRFTFIENSEDSQTAIALQLTIDLGASNVKCLGYDGYSNINADSRQQELFAENQILFSKFAQYTGNKITSLSPTSYDLEIKSIYICI